MNFSDLMKMLSNPDEIRRRMAEAQEKMASVRVTGSAGGGMVKIELNGRMEALSCEIAPEVMDPAEVAILQDLVRAALNDALAKLRENMGASMGMPGATGGVDPNGILGELFGGKR